MTNESLDTLEKEAKNVDQVKWLCEISMKRLEAANRDFDTINTRAGVVIGFAGLFNSLLIPSWSQLPKSLRFSSGIAWLAMVMIMLYFAFSAYRVSQVESIPLKRQTIERYLASSDAGARLQFMSDAIQAADRMMKVNHRKSSHLGIAIVTLALQVFLSLLVTILGLVFM